MSQTNFTYQFASTDADFGRMIVAGWFTVEEESQEYIALVGGRNVGGNEFAMRGYRVHGDVGQVAGEWVDDGTITGWLPTTIVTGFTTQDRYVWGPARTQDDEVPAPNTENANRIVARFLGQSMPGAMTGIPTVPPTEVDSAGLEASMDDPANLDFWLANWDDNTWAYYHYRDLAQLGRAYSMTVTAAEVDLAITFTVETFLELLARENAQRQAVYFSNGANWLLCGGLPASITQWTAWWVEPGHGMNGVLQAVEGVIRGAVVATAVQATGLQAFHIATATDVAAGNFVIAEGDVIIEAGADVATRMEAGNALIGNPLPLGAAMYVSSAAGGTWRAVGSFFLAPIGWMFF